VCEKPPPSTTLDALGRGREEPIRAAHCASRGGRFHDQKCDGKCDGSSDFTAQNDIIDSSRSNRVSKLRISNTVPENPAYRLARHKLFESKAVTI
jgi:hypothetical protein